MKRLRRPPLWRLFVHELLALWLISAGLYGLFDAPVALGFLAGGLVCWIPNGWLALRAFQTMGAAHSTQMVQNFYRGEVGKFILTMVGFATVFMNRQLFNAGAVFAGYGSVLFLHCVFLPSLLARWRPGGTP